MKKQLMKSIILTFLIFGLSSCDFFGNDDFNSTSKKEREAAEVITEFIALKQCYTLDMLKTFSDDYTVEFFRDDDLTYEEIDQIFANIADLGSYEKDVNLALKKLNIQLNAEKSGNLKSVQGLGSAFRSFFEWMSGSGKRSRKRILTIASHLNKKDKETLYKSLRKNWKKKAKNEKDFWNKLEKGDFDNQASQMYNDFYHNVDTDFPYLAHDKGLTMAKVTYREGAEGVTKGSKLMIEIVKKAVPALGKGMDYAEKTEEYVKKVKQIYKDPKGAIKDEVKAAIADKMGGFVDIDGAVKIGLISENVAEGIKIIADYAWGSEDPSDWVKTAMDKYGVGKVLDSDAKGDKVDIVIAENKNPNAKGPAVVVSVDAKKEVSSGSSIVDILLPIGEWIINAFDKTGNSDKVEVNINEKDGTVIVVSTDPEGEHEKGEIALSVWASPSDPGPSQSVRVHAKVSPAKSGVKIQFSITGTDGYDNQSVEETDSSGMAFFTIPGGEKGVKDVVTIKIVETGLTRTINYSF